MAVQIPKASFVMSKTGLSVQFNDQSLNNPTSWAWDFGDGTTDNVQNPLKVYASGGFYVVSLIATNSAGSSEELQLSIGVSDTNSYISNYPIWFMSEQLIPTELRGQIEDNEKHSMIQKWQLYLYPLIPSDITKPADEIDVHQEKQYHALVNELVSALVAHDLIVQAANQFISGSSIDTVDSITSAATEGDLKRIETGPAQVEWHPTSGAEDTDATASALSAAIKAGGTLDQLKALICQQSKRIRIYLPMCGQLSHSPQIPSKKTPDNPDTLLWPSFVPED